MISVFSAGSPGPFVSITPSGLKARISFGGGIGRNADDVIIAPHEFAHDIFLCAEIPKARRAVSRSPPVIFDALTGAGLHRVAYGVFLHFAEIGYGAGRDDRVHDARFAHGLRQFARVYAVHAHDVVSGQKLVEFFFTAEIGGLPQCSRTT